MNAFNYDENVEAPKPMKTPMIALASLSNEGPTEGQKTRIKQLSDVLEANGRSFADYNRIRV